MKLIRVFLSSPGDMVKERRAARKLLETLPREPLLRERIAIDPVSWDDPDAPAPMLANLSPQDAVNRGLPTPAQCDLTLVMLWGRMGTPLAQPRKKDGGAYRSGTEWEFENALEAGKDVLLYRRVSLAAGGDDPETREQKRLVSEFFLGLKNLDGSLRVAFTEYESVAEFSARLRQNIESLLRTKFLPNADEEARALALDAFPKPEAEEAGVSEVDRRAQAERLWRKSAASGDPNAMINVGLLIRNREPEEAAQWFEKAANAGLPDALFDLGMLLKERDPHAAEGWLRKSAEGGDLSGMAQLAYLVKARDPAEAEKWLEKAAEGGVEYAMTDLGLWLKEHDPQKAEVWLRRAARSSDPRGMYHYGQLLEKSDPAAARSWYEKARDAGNVDARLRLFDLD